MKKNRKIKSVIVATHDSLSPIRGGGALRTLKVAEEFKKRGHNVIIVAPTDGIGELSGIKVHWLHAPRKQCSQILSSLKFNIRLLVKFIQFVKNTDIFFIHNTIAAASMLFLKPIFGFKFVLDITDIHSEYLCAGERNIFEKILSPYLLYLEYSIIRSADSLIVATKAMKVFLVSKGVSGNKITVAYDGAEIDKISKDKDPDAVFNIIHLGSVDKQHGVELIVKAAPRIIFNFPKTKFFIIGGGRSLPMVKSLAKKLDVYDNFIFTDILNCEKSRQYLKKAGIGVILRQKNTPNNIITTLKLFEYWASATAVISSRLDGIAEVAQDNKDILFFEPNDAEDLARKVCFLLGSPQKIEELMNRGLDTVKKFTWNMIIPQIVDIVLYQSRAERLLER